MDVFCRHTNLEPLENLKPNPKNPNKHPRKQLELLVKVIQKNGWRSPIVVSKRSGYIVKGHGRYEAAKLAGFKEVPIEIQEYASEIEEYSDMIADNRISELSTLQNDDLKEILSGFNVEDILGGSTGFTDTELERILNDGETAADNTSKNPLDELDAKWKVKTGDIYLIGGKHKLMCGDSTDKKMVELLLNGEKPKLMVTDPPYGVEYDPDWRNEARCNQNDCKGRTGTVQNDDIIDWNAAYTNFNADVAYVWHAGKYTHIVAQSIEEAGFELISQIVWVKDNFAISRGDYHWAHEPCWYAVKKGKKHNWNGSRKESTVWNIAKIGGSDQSYGHGTQKPIDCMARPILNNSERNDIVCDCFLGSGTTMHAAHLHNRVCYGMELDVKYCAAILQRMNDLGLSIDRINKPKKMTKRTKSQ